MAAKGWCSVARQTFGRLTPLSPPSDAQNRPSGLSFSESFGLVPIRPLVENPVFMRFFLASILPGFDSDTLTTPTLRTSVR